MNQFKDTRALFPKSFRNTNHIQRSPEHWESASDEEHLEGMDIEVHRINPYWMAYLQKYRPHLVKEHLEEKRQKRFLAS